MDLVEPADALGADARAKMNFFSPKLKLDELFMYWLSSPDVQQNLAMLIKDVESGIPASKSAYGTYRQPPSPHSPHGVHKSPSQSPSSSPTPDRAVPVPTLRLPPVDGFPSPGSPTQPVPKKSPRSPLIKPTVTAPLAAAAQAASAAAASAAAAAAAASAKPTPASTGPKPLPIPQWYTPKSAARTPSAEWVGPRRARAVELFGGRGVGLQLRDFAPVVKQVIGLPAWFAGPVFRRLDRRGAGRVDLATFEAWWTGPLQSAELAERLFAFLKAPARNYLVPDDFRELLRELMDVHPGLEFLKSTPEFQERYAETVIHRIFYTVNRAGDGRLTLKELAASDLPDVMLFLDDEPEINKVLRYFSYEHFYVIYCKFWELDTDHNQLIDKDDLLRYNQHALTYRVVERIFAGAPRKLRSGQPGYMCYEDFVWFILSEEDKNTDTALEYWFRCIDLDADGVLSFYEMEHFYTEQLHRMEAIQMEPVGFLDILCQMLDMIKPDDRERITLRDLRRCQMAGNLFNVLFNLTKFIAIEQKDPFMSRGDAPESDWDKFARAEYDRLSSEDDQGQAEDAVDEDDSAAWMAGGGGVRESPF